MKVTMVMVMSADGKITKGDDLQIYNWTSEEDQQFFFSLLKKQRLIVMGRKTYDAARARIKLARKTLRLVLTRSPHQYNQETQKGMLEFTDESPQVLVARLESKGYVSMLLVGGGEVNAAFLQAGLVHDIYLTIEPKLFGMGAPVIASIPFDVRLTLISMKKCNPAGTLLIHYQVIS